MDNTINTTDAIYKSNKNNSCLIDRMPTYAKHFEIVVILITIITCSIMTRRKLSIKK